VGRFLQPRFALGQVVMTRGVADLVESGVIEVPQAYVLRHVTGDWAELDDHDRRCNKRAVLNGERIFSVFKVTATVKIYVITEWDRSVTTLLLPLEY
jgi:hypothetical protein